MSSSSRARQPNEAPLVLCPSQDEVLNLCSLAAPHCSLCAPSCSPDAPLLRPFAPSLLPLKRPCSLSQPEMATLDPKFGVYIIYIYIYSISELRLICDLLTWVPPLYSRVNVYFINMLSLYSPMLPRCFPTFPLSHSLLFSCYCVLTSLNESVQSACFGCSLERSRL